MFGSGSLQSYHRADILTVLLRHIPEHYCTHFGKRLVSYDDFPDGSVTMTFKDGTTATCDLLVGADGIKSAVRRTMYSGLAAQAESAEEKEGLLALIKPTWTGQYIYRGVIKTEDLKKASPDHPALDGPIYVRLVHETFQEVCDADAGMLTVLREEQGVTSLLANIRLYLPKVC